MGSAKAKRDADACLTKQGSKGRLTWDAAEGPPEVEMKHNGKRNEKGDSWHSMHMVQRLRYHEVCWCQKGFFFFVLFYDRKLCVFPPMVLVFLALVYDLHSVVDRSVGWLVGRSFVFFY